MSLAASLSGASSSTTERVVSEPSEVRSPPGSTRATPSARAAADLTSSAAAVRVTTCAGSEEPEG